MLSRVKRCNAGGCHIVFGMDGKQEVDAGRLGGSQTGYVATTAPFAM